MKKYKELDCWISTGLIIGFALLILFNPHNFPENLIAAYLVVGGWQITSMLVHIACGYFTQIGGARFIYHWISFIAVITLPASCWVLFYAAPFMAIYYTWLCFTETYIKMKRPMELLK